MIHWVSSITLALFLLVLNPNNTGTNNAMEDEYQRLVEKLKSHLRLTDSELPQQQTTTTTKSINTRVSQHWIGVAGGPGSGKSTVTTQVAQRLNAIYQNSVAIVIPMDGWHIPQVDLIQQYGMDGMKRRGAPDTFNVEQMIQELTLAKQLGRGSFPIYSREISEPVRDGSCELNNQHRIVFVEGLYVWLQHDPNWKPLTDLWDEQWYIQAPSRDIQMERLIRRSLKTWTPQKAELWGPGRRGAQRKVETIDIPNMDWVEPSQRFANEIIVTR
jgi:pantothenate kinase